MAILNGPLFGTEAKGKIKSELTLFPRSANINSTDEGDPRWFHFVWITHHKQSHSPPRQAQKNKFRDALIAWYALSPEDQSYWATQATGLQTGFNAFMSNYLKT